MLQVGTITNAGAAKRLGKAHTTLLLDSPWFGHLAFKLRCSEQVGGTFSVDGTTLRYNPEFMGTLGDAELVGVLAHEILHCALLHPYRLGARDRGAANAAMDYAINGILGAGGFKLPVGALLDSQYDGMAWEEIYGMLPRGDTGDGPGGGDGGDCPTGEVQAPPKSKLGDGPGGGAGGPDADAGDDPSGASNAPVPIPGDGGMSETDWALAARQATMVTKKAGKMPAGVERALGVSVARVGAEDLYSRLKRFTTRSLGDDYSWCSPNRRMLGAGVILPGVVREGHPRMGAAIDTSGSIGSVQLAAFGRVLDGVMREVRPAALDVVYCDSAVADWDVFSPDDGGDVVLRDCGGGGTAFQPALDWLTQPDSRPATVGRVGGGKDTRGSYDGNGQVACIVYLTDLCAGDTPSDPGVPVLWVCGLSDARHFGENVSRWGFGELFAVDWDAELAAVGAGGGAL